MRMTANAEALLSQTTYGSKRSTCRVLFKTGFFFFLNHQQVITKWVILWAFFLPLLSLILAVVAVSFSIEGEYVPVEGDEVTYKVSRVPPKNLKVQAVEVKITHQNPGTKHETWSGQIISS